jgi:uncharacterized cupredoxin-like copper-binding protein
MKGLHERGTVTRGPGLLMAALVVGMSIALTACGVGTPTPPPTAVPTEAPTATSAPVAATATSGGGMGAGAAIDITLSDFVIAPKAIDATAGTVTFKVTNTGKSPHNFAVVSNGQEVKKTKNLVNGQSDTLEMDLTAGTYQVICDIPGHKEAGMVGTLTVK